jgi:O-succinylbenzoic acid--CoA ligase
MNMDRTPALITDARVLDFAELERRAAALGPDAVTLVAEPTFEAVATAQSALCAGRLLLPAHPRWPEREQRKLWSRGRQAVGAQVVLRTSGSSGEPKLVVHDARSLTASARMSSEHLGWRDDDRWLLCLPFSHVGGLSILIRCLAARRPVVALPSFDPDAVLDAIVRHRVTLLSLVPTMLQALLEHDRRGVLTRPRALLVGGAHTSAALRAEAHARKVPIATTYGLTETASQVATQVPGQASDPRSEDSGRPLPGVGLRITQGRVEVRGPMLMRGYLGEPALAPDAWFATGDLGALDEQGRLHVHGRADEIIVSGGENVAPAEVERVFGAIPGVRAALVFGVPDVRWGELIAVALVLGEGISARAVLDRARPELPTYARPRRWARVAALPLGPSGKPDRARARRDLASRLEPV